MGSPPSHGQSRPQAQPKRNACMRVRVCVCAYACACMRVRVCVCVYACACMRVRMRISPAKKRLAMSTRLRSSSGRRWARVPTACEPHARVHTHAKPLGLRLKIGVFLGLAASWEPRPGAETSTQRATHLTPHANRPTHVTQALQPFPARPVLTWYAERLSLPFLFFSSRFPSFFLTWYAKPLSESVPVSSPPPGSEGLGAVVSSVLSRPWERDVKKRKGSRAEQALGAQGGRMG
jgi:hypothetical protein